MSRARSGQSGISPTLEVMAGQTLRRRLGRAFLRVRDGPDAGKEVSVTGTRVTGGRSKVADLVLTEESVSGTHFELVLSDDGVMLRDLGSTNGTKIGEARIREAWLEPGMVFQAGRCGIELLAADEVDVPISGGDHFENLFGASEVMREVFAMLERLASKPIDVLLGGETGTGKELAARGLHARSNRGEGPFVVLDCASLPRELAEAMVLGHRKGAFTGATSDRAGCFEEANGGTLFMDEIGELPLELQPKLLRVLDRREVQRIGETTPRQVDVRVIAATHRDLRQMVAEGQFREDLYFRIAEIVVELPPLRDRGDDVLQLAERFLAEYAGQRGDALQLDDGTRSALASHTWPGNVRELRKVIKRVAILATGPIVGREDLALHGRQRADAEPDDLFALPFKDARDAFERAYFTRLLERTGGNISEAARRSDYSRQGLRDLLRRLDIYPGE